MQPASGQHAQHPGAQLGKNARIKRSLSNFSYQCIALLR